MFYRIIHHRVDRVFVFNGESKGEAAIATHVIPPMVAHYTKKPRVVKTLEFDESQKVHGTGSWCDATAESVAQSTFQLGPKDGAALLYKIALYRAPICAAMTCKAMHNLFVNEGKRGRSRAKRMSWGLDARKTKIIFGKKRAIMNEPDRKPKGMRVVVDVNGMVRF